MNASLVRSILLDTFIIFFLFTIAGFLDKKIKLATSIKFWSGFLFLIAALPLQLYPEQHQTDYGGIGMPYLSLLIVGIGWTIINIKLELFTLLFVSIIIFLFRGINLFLYPFLAIFAAIGMSYMIDYRVKIKGDYISYPKIFSYIFISASVVILLLSSGIFRFRIF